MTTTSGYDLAGVRGALPILDDLTYLNTGTVGIMAEPVLKRHLEAIAAYERGGHAAQAAARASYEGARVALAALLNVPTTSLALTRNATDGVNFVAAGLRLDPGATVLTTDQEHPAVLLPWALAERRGGGRLRFFAVGATPEESLLNFQRALTPEVRAVVVSHVSCETGARLPVEDICALARARGAWTLVDGAQSVGQFPVDAAAIGCDFMTGNGHKWLSGPKGTGFLYVRPEAAEQVEPMHVGDGAVAPAFDRRALGERVAEGDWSFAPDATRFEFGTRNWHTFAALPAAIDYLADLGWDAIQQHGRDLSGELKRRLAADPGLTLRSPVAWEDSSALVTFSLAGWRGEDLSGALWERFRLIQRRVQDPSGVRISCAYFNDEADLDRLIRAVRDLRDGTPAHHPS